MKKVMRRIRKLVYRMGFRPRPGSIFFSPSITLRLKAERVFRQRRWMTIRLHRENDGSWYWSDYVGTGLDDHLSFWKALYRALRG